MLVSRFPLGLDWTWGMEKVGFKEISVVEHRLLQNVDYFQRLRRRVIILFALLVVCVLACILVYLVAIPWSLALQRSCYSVLVTGISGCLFFIFLALRNGRHVYLTCSYRKRVNQILRQFSLNLDGELQFEPVEGMPNANYNYSLYKMQSKTRTIK